MVRKQNFVRRETIRTVPKNKSCLLYTSVSKEDNKVVLTIDGKPFEADVVMAENGTCNILMDGRTDDLYQIVTLKLLSDSLMKRIRGNYRFIVSFNFEIVDSQAKYLRMRKKGEDEQNDRITSPLSLIHILNSLPESQRTPSNSFACLRLRLLRKIPEV